MAAHHGVHLAALPHLRGLRSKNPLGRVRKRPQQVQAGDIPDQGKRQDIPSATAHLGVHGEDVHGER